MKYKQKLPWTLVGKLLKQHLSTIEQDSENHSIHVNRKKAQDFA
jgi:hypothetical protein